MLPARPMFTRQMSLPFAAAPVTPRAVHASPRPRAVGAAPARPHPATAEPPRFLTLGAADARPPSGGD